MRSMLRVEKEIKLSRRAHNICERRWRKSVKMKKILLQYLGLLSIKFSAAMVASSAKLDNVSSSSNHLVTVQTNHFQKN